MMKVEFSPLQKRKPANFKRAPNADKAASHRSRSTALKPLTNANHGHKPNAVQRLPALHRTMPAHWDAKVDALLQQAIQTIDNYMRQEKQVAQRHHSRRRNQNGARKHAAISRKDWRGCTAAEQKQYKRESLRSWRNINCVLCQTQQGVKYLGDSSKISKRQQ